MKHFKRSKKLNTAEPKEPEAALQEAIADCINTLRLNPAEVMVGLFPLTAHAGLAAGLNCADFVETAQLTFNGIADRFPNLGRSATADEDFNESEGRWIAAFRSMEG